MSLIITQYEGKWRIEIKEIWEFEKKECFSKCLKDLIDYKAKFGNLFRKNDKP